MENAITLVCKIFINYNIELSVPYVILTMN